MISLITDIDGTLVGDRAALAVFNEFILPYRKKIFLVYATGRSMEEYENILKDGLLLPDAMILNTGADIYIKKQDKYELENAWHEMIKNETWNAEKVISCLSGFENISIQEKRNPYKISYFTVKGSETEARKKVEGKLENRGIRAKTILSHGIYLDVLPLKCDKGEAAEFLTDKVKIKKEKVIVAGDSENDLDLFVKFRHGIVVSNAFITLKDKLRGMDFYFAREAFAAGLVEGLKYYITKGFLVLNKKN